MGVPIVVWEDGGRLVRIVTTAETASIARMTGLTGNIFDETVGSIVYAQEPEERLIVDRERDWETTLVYIDGDNRIQAVLQFSEFGIGIKGQPGTVYLWGVHPEHDHDYWDITDPRAWSRIYSFLQSRDLLGVLENDDRSVANFYGSRLVFVTGTRAAIAAINENLWSWSAEEEKAFFDSLRVNASSDTRLRDYAKAYLQMRRDVADWNAQLSDCESLMELDGVALFDEMIDRGTISESDDLWEHRDLVRAALGGDDAALEQIAVQWEERDLKRAIEKIRDQEVNFVHQDLDWDSLRKSLENEADSVSLALISHTVRTPRFHSRNTLSDHYFAIDRKGASSSSENIDYVFGYGAGEHDYRPFWVVDDGHVPDLRRSSGLDPDSLDPIGALPTLLSETRSGEIEEFINAPWEDDPIYQWPGPRGAIYQLRPDFDALMDLAEFVFISDVAGLLSDEQREAWRARLKW